MRTIVKRHKASGHEETHLIIDFRGVTESDMRMLAEFYVQHRVEHEFKSWEYKLPEQITVLAADYIHKEVFIAKPINLPKKNLDKATSKARQVLETALAGLTKEEIAALFNENHS